jgi:HK97 gp10 family phage protein
MAGRVELHRSTYERATQKAARKWADDVGQAITAEAKRRCPVDEGTLRASITHVTKTSKTTATVVVGSPLPYAEYFHTGTGIYGPKATPITPTTRKALKFKWDGPGVNSRAKDKRGYVFAKSVKGMKPDPFLADAIESVMGIVRKRVK